MKGKNQFGTLTMICRPIKDSKLTEVKIFKVHQDIVGLILNDQYEVKSHEFKLIP